MRVGGYATQARFLLNCGLLDELARSGDPQSTAYLRQASAVHKLTSPAEMGELFKVLALVRGVDLELAGFREGAIRAIACEAATADRLPKVLSASRFAGAPDGVSQPLFLAEDPVGVGIARVIGGSVIELKARNLRTAPAGCSSLRTRAPSSMFVGGSRTEWPSAVSSLSAW